MATKKVIDTRDEIREHLNKIKRPLRWISQPNTTIPYGSIYSIFEHKVMELTQDRLDIINAWLETEFVLPAKAPGTDK
jgi:hypothetical protein